MEPFTLFALLFLYLGIILNLKKAPYPVRNPIQFWQFLLTIFAMLVSFGLYLNGMSDRTARLEVTQEAQQKQIDELKVTTNQIKGTMDDIKEDLGNIKGDVKVILSKVN